MNKQQIELIRTVPAPMLSAWGRSTECPWDVTKAVSHYESRKMISQLVWIAFGMLSLLSTWSVLTELLETRGKDAPLLLMMLVTTILVSAGIALLLYMATGITELERRLQQLLADLEDNALGLMQYVTSELTYREIENAVYNRLFGLRSRILRLSKSSVQDPERLKKLKDGFDAMLAMARKFGFADGDEQHFEKCQPAEGECLAPS